MAGIPQNFQAISNVLPTYNFVDIIAGTGYINFYAGDTVDLKPLSNFTYYSDAGLDSAVTPGNYTDQLIFDHDYDVLLNRPMDIKGLGIVNIPVGVNPAAAATMYIYAIVKIRKWDGASETEIATNTSRSFSKSTTGLGFSMLGVDVTIPLTHFKIGEYLRLTIMIYGTSTNLAGATFAYAHDPKSRTSIWDSTGAVPSQLLFQCPVRLNL